jgi:hypothetical protein
MSTDPGMRLVDWAWLGWIVNHLDDLAHEIRAQLGREPDPGDLLIILASAPDTVPSRALQELGVVVDQLGDVAEEVRGRPSERDLFAATEHVRQQKELALEAGQTDLADRLREEERRLTKKSNEDRLAVIALIRARLGLTER